MSKIKKAVIPVAGLGTRGLPVTKEVPKEMLPILDTPSIDFLVEEVVEAGVEQVIFVTSRGKSSIEDYFDRSPGLEYWLKTRKKDGLAENLVKLTQRCEVVSIRQKEPLGLGHAVLCAKNLIGKDPFIVCLADELFPPWNPPGTPSALKALISAYEKTEHSVIGVREVPTAETCLYGIVDVGGLKLQDQPATVKRAVEKPQPPKAPSNYAIIGRYLFEPEILDFLSKTTPGPSGEIQLTDAMDSLAQKGRLGALHLNQARYDIGNPLYYVRAQVDAALRRPELAEALRSYLRTL